MSWYRVAIVAFVVLVFGMGCRKTAPQRPTYHNGRQDTQADSTLLMAIETNQHLAEEADRALTRYVQEGYAQQELGYWSKGLRLVDQPLKEGERATIHLQVYTLDGLLLEDKTEDITIGKTQQIQAVEDALGQMEKGQSVSLIVPWYLGWGATGSETVAPYTNTLVELGIRN